MLFNSGVFLKFFAAFLLLYWLVRNHLRARNLLIVAASYLFYGWWDYRFLALLFISSLPDYSVGRGLERLTSAKQRKLLLTASILGNLSILGFFKYYDFFVGNLQLLFSRLNWPLEVRTLEIILPVGISFYTFQTMSYAIDVYRGQMPASRNFINFLAYVSFFPQLVAGPIERARHLLPQFGRTLAITIPMVQEGLWLCLWGMFKKVVLADNLAPLVEMVYGSESYAGPAVILGTIAFGFQIYCDFSGYSDIARGGAKILGFDIMFNFNIPYAAQTLREFWQRWHISLSTWLRDYLYISLGGNRAGSARTCLNLILTMFLGGLWHGAAWNFVLWGLWHGLWLVVERIAVRSRFTVHWPRLLSHACTLGIVFYGWLLFRAGSAEQIGRMSQALFEFSAPPWLGSYVINLVAFTLPLILMELWQMKARTQLVALSLPFWGRALLQGALLWAILLFWVNEKTSFIYFQF